MVRELHDVYSIKNSYTKIYLHEYDEMKGDKIPSNIKHLEISIVENTINNLPNSILKLYAQKLYIECKLYNHEYNVSKFTCNINNLSKSLIELSLYTDFYNYINNLPNSIKKIEIIACPFNKKINNLPNTLINVDIEFTELTNIFKLPNNIKYLKLDYVILHSNIKLSNISKLNIYGEIYIINYVSKTLQHFVLCDNDFNEKINNLNHNLKKLDLYCELFNQKCNNLPNSLTYLKLKSNNFNHNLIKLPEKLSLELELKHTIETNSYHIIFSDNRNYKFNYINMSESVKILEFKFSCHKFITPLPLKLEKLILYEYQTKLTNLPNTLKELHIRHYDFIFDFLPKGLEKLILYRYNKKLDNLPNSLKELQVENYNFSFDFLPEGIEILRIPNYQKQLNDLPSSVKEIWIYNHDKQNINKIYHHKINYIKNNFYM